MSATYTENLELYQPEEGETGWADEINENFDILDTVISVAHNADGSHKSAVINATNLDLGTLEGQISADNIPNGTTKGIPSLQDLINFALAYGWGDHALAGYLKSETDPVFTNWNKSTGISITESQISDLKAYLTSETDPVFSASDVAGVTSTDISNWDTAHGWGNHADGGYQPTNEKGQANGYAGLNANSKVASANLDLAPSYPFEGTTAAQLNTLIQEVNAAGGGTILLKAQTYTFTTGGIELLSNVTIKGYSKTTTIIDISANPLNSDLFLLVGSNLIVEDFGVLDNSSNTGSIFATKSGVANGEFFTAKNINLINVGYRGVNIQEKFVYFQFINCWFECSDASFYAANAKTAILYFKDSTFLKTSNGGYIIYRTTNATVSASKVTLPKTSGIFIDNCTLSRKSNQTTGYTALHYTEWTGLGAYIKDSTLTDYASGNAVYLGGGLTHSFIEHCYIQASSSGVRKENNGPLTITNTYFNGGNTSGTAITLRKGNLILRNNRYYRLSYAYAIPSDSISAATLTAYNEEYSDLGTASYTINMQYETSSITLFNNELFTTLINGYSARVKVYNLDYNSGDYSLDGNLNVGGDFIVNTATGVLNSISMPEYADNAAALVGGLVEGDFYKTETGQLMIVIEGEEEE